MEALHSQTADPSAESVSRLDKARAAVTLAAAAGELGVVVPGLVDTGNIGGKAIVAAGLVLILQGIPALDRIDAYQRYQRGI
jgi:hypothetical protein